MAEVAFDSFERAASAFATAAGYWQGRAAS